jgi:hypothetical protein
MFLIAAKDLREEIYDKYVSYEAREKGLIQCKATGETIKLENLDARTCRTIANLFVDKDLKSFFTVALRNDYDPVERFNDAAFFKNLAISAPNITSFEDWTRRYDLGNDVSPYLLSDYLNVTQMKNLQSLTLNCIHQGDLTLIASSLHKLESLDVKFCEQVDLMGKY